MTGSATTLEAKVGQTFIPYDATGSTLPYRRGVLKKFISNVLFLDAEVSEWEQREYFEMF